MVYKKNYLQYNEEGRIRLASSSPLKKVKYEQKHEK